MLNKLKLSNTVCYSSTEAFFVLLQRYIIVECDEGKYYHRRQNIGVMYYLLTYLIRTSREKYIGANSLQTNR